MSIPFSAGESRAPRDVICSMYCDYFILFFKIKCPGKIPNIQGIWEICPGNQWFQDCDKAFRHFVKKSRFQLLDLPAAGVRDVLVVLVREEKQVICQQHVV